VFYVASGTFQSRYGWSPCRSSCKHLEAAPSGWFGGGTDPRLAPGFAAGGLLIGDGGYNREFINHYFQDPNSAMEAVNNYLGGGKNDWFIPSRDELNEMYKNKSSIPGLLTQYLTSSSKEEKYAYTQIFNYPAGGEGGIAYISYDMTAYVRPVRAF
jgi:hypothetical protein